MHANDLFTAPQLAKLCSTDLKTIHNWVSRGEIKYFRTPGRHLRFRRDDIAEFLTKFGYPIPEGFSIARRRVVVVDGAASSREHVARSLGAELEVEAFADYLDAAIAIGREEPQIVCVNADSGPEMHHAANRFAACVGVTKVVVYGEAAESPDLDMSLVRVRTGDGADLGRVVRTLLKTS